MIEEQGPPAHTPRPSLDGVRPALVNVDSSGLSMSWKTFWWSLGIVSTAIGACYAFAQSLVFDADLRRHDSDDRAHPVVVTGQSKPRGVAELIAEHEHKLQAVPKIEKELARQGGTLDAILAGMIEERAERIADEAMKSLPLRKRTRQTWEEIRDDAIENQRAGKKIRAGLEHYFR